IEWRLAAAVSMTGTLMTILLAGILWGLAPRFRTSTSRLSLRLPRYALVAFWITGWMLTTSDLAEFHGWWSWPSPKVVHWAATAVALLAVAVYWRGLGKLPDQAERRLRASAPPLYRSLAWAGACLGLSVESAFKQDWSNITVGGLLFLLGALIFFLGYYLDARWYRHQLLPAQDGRPSSPETEGTPATQ
ncbi:MAG: hypothetical protein JXA57_15270, partial [Armatimonadetes bacterium]|nr:hypothetical protein [Armatimonadota bacterium]